MKKNTSKKTTPEKKPPWAKKVFIIAEAGSNWRSGGSPAKDLAQAKSLIEAAADAGADAVKFQTYRAKKVYAHNAGKSDYLSAAGIKKSITEIFRDLEMPYTMIGKLAKFCRELGVQFMSSPFSLEDARAVDPHVAIHKIASYEITHIRLIEFIAGTGKPLILSTGAATFEEIRQAAERFRTCGGRGLALMQCTAKYPAPLNSMNLRAMPALAAAFDVPAGLSDHSREPLIAPVAAVALGARIIEKHFTLDNNLPGPDHAFAVTPDELARMTRAIRSAEKTLGSGKIEPLAAEAELRLFAQRAIQATRKIKKGETLREGFNFDILRPGKQRKGLNPARIAEIDGKTATRAIPPGDGILDGDFK